MKKLFENWRRFVINEVENTTPLSQEDFTSPEFEAYHTALMKASRMVGHDVAINDPSVGVYLDKAIEAAMKVKQNYDFDRIMKLFNRTRMLQDLEKIIINNLEYETELANVEKYGDPNNDDEVGRALSPEEIEKLINKQKDDRVDPALTIEEFIELIKQKDKEEEDNEVEEEPL